MLGEGEGPKEARGLIPREPFSLYACERDIVPTKLARPVPSAASSFCRLAKSYPTARNRSGRLYRWSILREPTQTKTARRGALLYSSTACCASRHRLVPFHVRVTGCVRELKKDLEKRKY